MFDKLLDFVVSSVRQQEQDKFAKLNEKWDASRPVTLSEFWADIEAGSLIPTCKKKAHHHRNREKVWIDKLAEAEKKLREEGVDLDVYDTASQTYANYSNVGHLASGAIGSYTQQFQPRVHPVLLDACKNAKTKMLDHRTKAEGYEKWARIFSVAPERKLRLTGNDIDYFGLESL
jgi:hypothetical protein